MEEIRLPRYKSHKVVNALKIVSVEVNEDGSANLTPSEPGYGSFTVPAEYVKKHQPHSGGYYVVYEDGYKSFSPAGAFESGYTLLRIIIMNLRSQDMLPEGKKQSIADKCVSNLEKANGDLNNTIDRLIDKLQPISAPYSNNPCERDEAPVQVYPPLFNAIRDATEKTENSVARLKDLIDRIEL